MSCLCKCFLAAKLCLLGAKENTLPAAEKTVIYQGKHVQVVVPERPLAANSVAIESLQPLKGRPIPLSSWNSEQNAEMYDMAQKIVKIWKDNHLADNYMIYGKEDTKSPKSFQWEIVPYPSQGWALWNQLKVLWNIIFGASHIDSEGRAMVAKQYDKYKNDFAAPLVQEIQKTQELLVGNDPFCNPQIIEKQRIFEGKQVNVLYNYAPVTIGEGKLHFLLMPKNHHEKFSDLTKDEYLEISELRSKLLKHYQGLGYEVAFVLNKTGAPAGQTVPHFHEHVILTASKMHELIGKLRVMKNMLFGSSKLPDDELKQKVASLKSELDPVLR
jgi:diadenosine tetraphosphate (Ap4A) HIT family hydrolase